MTPASVGPRALRMTLALLGKSAPGFPLSLCLRSAVSVFRAVDPRDHHTERRGYTETRTSPLPPVEGGEGRVVEAETERSRGAMERAQDAGVRLQLRGVQSPLLAEERIAAAG